MFHYFLKYWIVNAAVLATVFVLQSEVESITAWHPIFVVVTMCVVCCEKVKARSRCTLPLAAVQMTSSEEPLYVGFALLSADFQTYLCANNGSLLRPIGRTCL